MLAGMGPKSETDWGALVEALSEGDQLALIELSRLIASFLRRWSAYDFVDEWDDVIQEVLVATSSALREGKIRDRAAIVGYIKSTTRFKFSDRLKRHLRWDERSRLPWEDVVGTIDEAPGEGEPDRFEQVALAQALDQLEPVRRRAVTAVYAAGMSYQEAADDVGIPLGTLKQYLREGLASLRQRLRASPAGAGG